MASPPTDDDPTGVGSLNALGDRVRESAAWLVGAFGAVALLLVPGLQLANLGALDGARLELSIGAAVVAAVALGIAAALVAPFLRSNATTVADLAEPRTARDRRLVDALDTNVTLFQGEATSVADLQRQHATAWLALDGAEASLASAASALASVEAGAATTCCCFSCSRSSRRRQAERARAQREQADAAQRVAHRRDWVATVKQTIEAVEAVARFSELAIGFRRTAKWLVACTLVVAAAMVTFAVAAHPPPPGAADFAHATLTDLDLSGTDLRDATFSHATLTRVDLSDANLEGADVHGARWSDVTCPDGRSSDAVGATCAGHLTPADGSASADR